MPIRFGPTYGLKTMGDDLLESGLWEMNLGSWKVQLHSGKEHSPARTRPNHLGWMDLAKAPCIPLARK